MRAEVPPSNYRNTVPEQHESETPPVESTVQPGLLFRRKLTHSENVSLTTEQWPSPTLMHQPELRDATCPLPSESLDPNDQQDLHQRMLTSAESPTDTENTIGRRFTSAANPTDTENTIGQQFKSAANPTDTENTTGRSRRLRKPPKCPTALIDEAILWSEEHKARQRTKGQQQKTTKGREQ